MTPISRGFRGRRPSAETRSQLPPGQYETRDFPVLSAGPTPRISVATWDFSLQAADGKRVRWTWDEFNALPHSTVTTDIHCVTKWSKFGTAWEGISIDTLLAEASAKGITPSPYVMAKSDGGYTTNVPLADLTGGKAWVAFVYNGAPPPAERGAPARLSVPP